MSRILRISVEGLFRSLSDRTRLRLLNLLNGQEMCVCYFVEVLGASQPKISRHLANLRRAGLVTARKEGKWIHYRIALPPEHPAASMLKITLEWLAHDPQMKQDLARLNKVRSSPDSFVEIATAPPPGRSALVGTR